MSAPPNPPPPRLTLPPTTSASFHPTPSSTPLSSRRTASYPTAQHDLNLAPLAIPHVSALLNPPPPPSVDDLQRGQRRKASCLESPVFSAFEPLPGLHRPARDHDTDASAFPLERVGRHVLTPRSPSLHKAASLGQFHLHPTTTVAHSSAYSTSLAPRVYAMEPGTSVGPPVPMPPAAGFRHHASATPNADREAARRASTGAHRFGHDPSCSASPSTSYSDFIQSRATSPATQSGHARTSHPSDAPPISTHGGGVPISSSTGPTVYQMLTLNTGAGTVQLPVDMQAASRVADEKRRRNAGASARFRQRRKEKEREASTTISRLEQQVKDLGDAVEYWRNEATFHRNDATSLRTALSGKGIDVHFHQRAPSPRSRRSSGASFVGLAAGASAPPYLPAAPDSVSQTPDDYRKVRSRTLGYTATADPPPPPPHTRLASPTGRLHIPAHPPPTHLRFPHSPQTADSLQQSPQQPQQQQQYQQHQQHQQQYSHSFPSPLARHHQLPPPSHLASPHLSSGAPSRTDPAHIVPSPTARPAHSSPDDRLPRLDARPRDTF